MTVSPVAIYAAPTLPSLNGAAAQEVSSEGSADLLFSSLLQDASLSQGGFFTAFLPSPSAFGKEEALSPSSDEASLESANLELMAEGTSPFSLYSPPTENRDESHPSRKIFTPLHTATETAVFPGTDISSSPALWINNSNAQNNLGHGVLNKLSLLESIPFLWDNGERSLSREALRLDQDRRSGEIPLGQDVSSMAGSGKGVETISTLDNIFVSGSTAETVLEKSPSTFSSSVAVSSEKTTQTVLTAATPSTQDATASLPSGEFISFQAGQIKRPYSFAGRESETEKAGSPAANGLLAGTDNQTRTDFLDKVKLKSPGLGESEATSKSTEKIDRTLPGHFSLERTDNATLKPNFSLFSPIKETTDFSHNTLIKNASSPSAGLLSPSEQRHVIDQLVKQATVTLSRGESHMSLELQPKELGRVDMDVVMKGNQLTLDVRVESHAVREAMETNFISLKEQLHQQGVHVSRMEVAVQAELGNMNRQGHSPERRPHPLGPDFATTDEENRSSPSAEPSDKFSRSRVNILV